jgi:predicted flap endonuclease-1-like 5' DNA nuclease
MSIVSILVFLVVLAAGCVGSWQAALHRHNRTRNPNKEDPRDQEIRQLSAALNIARKDIEKLGNTSGTQDSEITELQDKLQKSGDTLSDIQQKYNATKENLNNEIEGKEELQEELVQLRRDLEISNTRLTELEVQNRLDTPGSGLVAGLDDMLDDDEKEVFTIRQEHKELKRRVKELTQTAGEQQTEAERWKQHCTVMSKTNKTLKRRLDGMGEAEQKITGLQAKLQNKVKDLGNTQKELDETRKLNNQLQTQVADFKHMQAKLELLQTETEELNELRKQNEQLQAQMSGFGQMQEEHKGMQTRLEALNQIQDENEKLLAQVRDVRQTVAAELSQLQKENQQLRVQVEALDEIQSENEKLTSQTKELSQTQDENNQLQARLKDLNQMQTDQLATNEKLEAKLKELERDTQEIELLSSQAEDLAMEQNQNENLRAQAKKLGQTLRDQVKELSQLRDEAEQLRAQMTGLINKQAESKKQQISTQAQLTSEQEKTRALQARMVKLASVLKAGKTKATAFDDVRPQKKKVDSDHKGDSGENTDSMPALKTTDSAVTSSNGHDDLQLIHGVGAILEQKLNMLGIVNFRSLLELTPQDYERARELIPSLKKRVARDSWLDQARQLHQDKYNEVI